MDRWSSRVLLIRLKVETIRTLSHTHTHRSIDPPHMGWCCVNRDKPAALSRAGKTGHNGHLLFEHFFTATINSKVQNEFIEAYYEHHVNFITLSRKNNHEKYKIRFSSILTFHVLFPYVHIGYRSMHSFFYTNINSFFAKILDLTVASFISPRTHTGSK